MNETSGRRSPLRLPWWIALLGFLAIAITMNWTEHRAHILGSLPYLFLLACLLMHLFMHHGHEGHGDHGNKKDQDPHAGHQSQTPIITGGKA